MSRRQRQRRAALNAVDIAINNARRLSPADVRMQSTLTQTAAGEFACGINCPLHWRNLADIANLAETLSAMNICSGPEADQVIANAQRTLHDVANRHRERSTWTLYADEIDALQWLVTLHIKQLEVVSYGEFAKAFERTSNRIAAARAGNASPDTIVVDGLIG